jgi:eukaryotic-like serine/threonine-protein kinase
MAEHTGQQLGPYRLLHLLGQSDWASVYLGKHRSLHRQVALKVFSLRLTGEEEARFHTEVRALMRLRHPALLPVLDGGVEGEHPFLVLAFAPGGSLRKRHPRGTILPAPIMLSYLHPLVAALQWVHEQGRLHSNIKPENMLLGATTEVLLSEGDLPVLTQRRHSLLLQCGSAAVTYLAPEQLHGQPQAASDQYALGVVVYEWLSGDVPFHDSFDELARRHRSVAPPSLREKIPVLSSYVEHVVQRALATDPALRFASVRAFAEELAEACQSTQATESQSLTSSPALLPLVPTVKLSPPAQGAFVPGTLLCTYRGHTHRVHAVAWSPDGSRLASGSRDKTVQVWEATTGKLLCSLVGHTDQVHAVAWSPDGRRLASAGADGTVRVWEATTGRNALTYRSRGPVVHTLAWSPDGKRIASDSSMMVEVWEALSANPLLIYRNHTYGVDAVAWSPDGKYLASGSTDQTVQVWDATTARTIFIHQGHMDEVNAVAWSPDGTYLASGSSDETVQVWGGAVIGTICTYRGHFIRVHAVAWSPDGRRLASGGDDGTVHVWDAATGGNVYIYRGHGGVSINRINAVAWSPDGTHIASASDDETVQVWRAS